MVVVNIVGFPYKIRLRSGIEIIIPYDNQPHEVPDEIAENNFNNVFRVLIPPKPKNIPIIPVYNNVDNLKVVNLSDKSLNILNETKTELEKDHNKIIEIDLESSQIDDNTLNIVNHVEELKEEIIQPPLKGIKIKTAKRNKLIKKGKPRDKSKELNNGNN